MTKTIALVVPSAANTGGVTTVAEFVMRTILDRSDYRVKVVSLATSVRDADSVRVIAPATWLRGITTSGGDFRGTPFTHVGALFTEFETQRLKPRAALARELKGVDLIQVVCGSPSWAAPVVGLGIPVCVQVATLVEVERVARDAALRGPIGAWRRFMTRRVAATETPAMRAATCIQVENAWMHDHVESVTRDVDTEVAYGYPGVDHTFFHAPEARPKAPGYILTVGRMSDPRKNHMLLLESYRLVHEKLADPPRLVLAGATDPTPAFTARVKALGLQEWVDVHIRPEREVLATLYRGARAFVLTSEEEGFGMTLVEAMASGVPSVSTRSGGPDEIINHGVDGFLTPCGDSAAVAAHLTDLVTDDALNTRISTAARQRVEARYSADVASAAFLDVYDRILRGATHRTGP